MAKKKARFQWFKTVALNPETLEEDLDWWAVKDTATNEWVSEHDNPRSARNLCRLLNWVDDFQIVNECPPICLSASKKVAP